LPDTTIVLDIALGRVPHLADSADVFREIDHETTNAFLNAKSITDISSVALKEKGHQLNFDFFTNLIESIAVIGIDWGNVKASLISVFVDYKNAIQWVLSRLNRIDYIITRILNDFLKSEITALSPNEYVALLKMKKL